MLVNALLGFREEYHAKKSLDEVSNSIDSEITVRRNSETKSISVKELVPGDIILLVGGTIVPAGTFSIITAAEGGAWLSNRSFVHSELTLSSPLQKQTRNGYQATK